MTILGTAGAGSAIDPPGDDEILALKTPERLYVRSAFSPQFDLVITLIHGVNDQIDFSRAALVDRKLPLTEATCEAGYIVHGNPDDSAPWKINDTYIGANHGWYGGLMEVPAVGQKFSAVDIGSAWLDEAGTRFYLVKVTENDSVWLMSDNSGTLDKWKFCLAMVGTTLKEESGRSRTLAIAGTKKVQLAPSCRIRSQDNLVEGRTPLVEGQVVRGAFLDINEEYDIINPADVLDAIKKNPGRPTNFVGPERDALITNRIRYRLQPQAASTVRHRSTVHHDVQLEYMGFLQTRALARRKEDGYRYYIPDTLPFQVQGVDYDFQTIQEFTAPPPVPIQIGVAQGNVTSSENLPHRFLQFLEKRPGSVLPCDVGYVAGYSLLEGCSIPATRAANTDIAAFIHTSGKTYPVALGKKMGRIPAGSTFGCLAYRQYFSPAALSPNATSVYWHQEAETTVLYVDYHHSVDEDIIKLPDSLTGQTVTVIESSPSIKLLSGDTVPKSGLRFSVQEGYGHMALALGSLPAKPEASFSVSNH